MTSNDQTTETGKVFDIDGYLAPLLAKDPKDSIGIAEFLAIELTVLRVGIEKLHADVERLQACVDRIESRKDS